VWCREEDVGCVRFLNAPKSVHSSVMVRWKAQRTLHQERKGLSKLRRIVDSFR
jgi:hypothetical protein